MTIRAGSLGRAETERYDMKNTALLASVAVLFGLLPLHADGVGSMQPKRNKDFRELIVQGERPEIAACLATAMEYARHAQGVSAIRWDDDASDRAHVRESESDGRLTRYVRLTAQMRMKRWNLFAETWRSMEVSCEQPEDGAIRLSVRPTAP